MSGIAGLFHPGTPKPVEPARVAAMAAAMGRGGAADVWTAPGIGLAHGYGPGTARDGDLAVLLDGELYDARPLRAELMADGAAVRSDTDAELLLHAWRAWGPAMLDRLSGVFALAIHDGERHALFLARDRLGVRPLHHAELADGSVAFASELKGLLAHPLLRRRPSLPAIEDYLAFGHVPDDASLVAGVSKLGAGRWLMLERGKGPTSPRRWWRPDFSQRAKGSAAVLADELLERLRDAVRVRMAAGPAGALPDDGGAVVALMAEASRAAVTTVALGRDLAAVEVADRFRTDHHVHRPDRPPFALLDDLVAAFDEPFADPAALAELERASFARTLVPAMMTGEGADEVMAGHRRLGRHVSGDRLRALVSPRLRRRLFGSGMLGDTAGRAYARSLSITPPELRARLFSPEARLLLAGHRAEDRFEATMAEAPAREALDRAHFAELTLRLPADMLTRLDRAGRAAGLGFRLPMVDHRLVAFCATLPASMRRRGGQGRWLLDRALSSHLPDRSRCAATPPSPTEDWFRGPLAPAGAALARSPVLSATGWFDAEVLADLAERHRAGRADHGATLWQLLVLSRSLERLFS